MYPCVDQTLGRIETIWNKLDYVPYLSSMSGRARILAGLVQMAAGAAFALLKTLQSMLDESFWTYYQARNGIAYSIHGLANIARGFVALFPGFNFLLIPYDYRIGRLNYRYEQLHPATYPLNQQFI